MEPGVRIKFHYRPQIYENKSIRYPGEVIECPQGWIAYIDLGGGKASLAFDESIFAFFVHFKSRQLGIGKRLFYELIVHLKNKDFSSLYVDGATENFLIVYEKIFRSLNEDRLISDWKCIHKPVLGYCFEVTLY